MHSLILLFTTSQAAALEEAFCAVLISLTAKATSTGVIALLVFSCTPSINTSVYVDRTAHSTLRLNIRYRNRRLFCDA